MKILTVIMLMTSLGLVQQPNDKVNESGKTNKKPAAKVADVVEVAQAANEPLVKQPNKALDYKTAYYNAQKGDKPLLILVSADWCPPCQQMKASTIPELQQRRVFDDFHFAKVNLGQQENLGRQLIGNRGIPQLIMFEKQDGKWVRRYLRGMQTASKVEQFMAQSELHQSRMANKQVKSAKANVTTEKK